MSVDERHRLDLHEAAKQTWGPEVAVTLMEMLPPGGWAEVATKQDVAGLRSELGTEIAGLRSELHVEMADFRTAVERSLRTSLMWTITTTVASSGVVLAAVSITR